MQVIFIQNVPGIGKVDDVKEVSEGYARNFLFAKNLAVPATKQLLADLKNRQTKKIKDEQAELRGQQSVSDKLNGYKVILKERVGSGGNLYAAVGPQKISEALAQKGFNITKDQIILSPIKETGEYAAKIKFPHGLEVKILVIVSKI